jgi:predicted N-acyltransferase
MGLEAKFLTRITEISSAHWNALMGIDYPFARHEFLAALEESGSVGPETGWLPQHLVIEDAASRSIVACMPLYSKQHSYGEYVFDWSWADAWERSGRSYYPKLVSAVPFTPATGPRLAISKDRDSEAVLEFAVKTLLQHAKSLGVSSWHHLFPDEPTSERFSQLGIVQRVGCQFHWKNRDYASFDDFLGTFTAKRRKTVRQERRRVADQGLEFECVSG